MLGLDVLDCFGEKLKFLLQKEDWEGINEIRVRTGRAVILKKRRGGIFHRPRRPADKGHRLGLQGGQGGRGGNGQYDKLLFALRLLEPA